MTPIDKNRQDCAKALGHLEYSLKKVSALDLARQNWSEEELETLESFSSRFARSSDLIIGRLLRSLALEQDPAFRGTLIDLLNLAEKTSWIDSAKKWFRIRELRNVAAHEYSTADFNQLIGELIQLSPSILQCRKLL